MLASVKAILGKPQSEWTEDDKKEVVEAIESFKKAIEEVCKEHGFAYKSILSITPEGVLPVLDIVQIKEDAV